LRSKDHVGCDIPPSIGELPPHEESFVDTIILNAASDRVGLQSNGDFNEELTTVSILKYLGYTVGKNGLVEADGADSLVALLSSM